MLGTHNIRGKMLGIGIHAKDTLGIGNVCGKNARNRKYTQRTHLESAMCAERTLEITITCKENTWNREKLRDVKDILEYVKDILKYANEI